MSTLVTDIITGIETRLAAVLTGYSPLRYYYDIEKNDYKGNVDRYGIIPKEIESQSGVIRSVTVNQTFQIILTTGYKNGPMSDSDLQSKVKTLYDKMDDVLHDLFLTKLGVPSIVLLSTLNGYEEPEILEEQKVVALRMDLTVRYRRDL
jgi:hypothetical protein